MTRMSGFGFPGDVMREMDRLVEGLLGADGAPVRTPGLAGRPFPALNLWEDEGSIFVEAELPGFKLDQLDITMTGNELIISGQRQAEDIPREATVHRRERPTGRFSRTVRLNVPVDAEKVSAAMTQGVLQITLPKAEAAKPRKIEVKSVGR